LPILVVGSPSTISSKNFLNLVLLRSSSIPYLLTRFCKFSLFLKFSFIGPFLSSETSSVCVLDIKSSSCLLKALALKAWGFGSVEAARNFANRHKKKT